MLNYSKNKIRELFYIIILPFLTLQSGLGYFPHGNMKVTEEVPLELFNSFPTLYNKTLFKKQYNFITKLLNNKFYESALIELASLTNIHTGKTLLYLGYMLARLQHGLGDSINTNADTSYQLIITKKKIISVGTNTLSYFYDPLNQGQDSFSIHTNILIGSLYYNPNSHSHYQKALQGYSRIIRYPNSPDSLKEKSILAKAALLWRIKDNPRSIHLLKIFIIKHILSPYLAEAYFLISQNYSDLGNLKESEFYLDKISRDFPSTFAAKKVKLQRTTTSAKPMKIKHLRQLINIYKEELEFQDKLIKIFQTTKKNNQ